jgi:hypothetical protein
MDIKPPEGKMFVTTKYFAIYQNTVEKDLKALLSYDFSKIEKGIIRLFLLYDGFYPYPLENPEEPWDSYDSVHKELEEYVNNPVNCRETNLIAKMNKYWNNTLEGKVISTYVQKLQKLYPEYNFIPIIVPFFKTL